MLVFSGRSSGPLNLILTMGGSEPELGFIGLDQASKAGSQEGEELERGPWELGVLTSPGDNHLTAQIRAAEISPSQLPSPATAPSFLKGQNLPDPTNLPIHMPCCLYSRCLIKHRDSAPGAVTEANGRTHGALRPGEHGKLAPRLLSPPCHAPSRLGSRGC